MSSSSHFLHPARGFTSLLGAVALLLSVACSAEPPAEPGPPADPRLSANRAPAGMSFATTRAVELRLEPDDVALAGNVIQLRVGLEPSISDPIYVGRAWHGQPVTLRLSMPTAASTLFWELTDETGDVVRGEVSP